MVLLFTVRTPCGPNALRFTGKRMSIACSSDSTQDFLRRLAALFQSIRWNRIRVRLSWIRAMFGCNAKSLPLLREMSARRHEFRARLNFARTPEPALKRWSESRKELSAAAELFLWGRDMRQMENPISRRYKLLPVTTNINAGADHKFHGSRLRHEGAAPACLHGPGPNSPRCESRLTTSACSV